MDYIYFFKNYFFSYLIKFSNGFSFWTIVGFVLLALLIYLVVRKNPYDDQHLKLKEKVGA